MTPVWFWPLLVLHVGVFIMVRWAAWRLDPVRRQAQTLDARLNVRNQRAGAEDYEVTRRRREHYAAEARRMAAERDDRRGRRR